MNKTEPIKCQDRSIHILFVDDDSDLVALMKSILERLGYIVTSAYNGIDAIKLIEKYHDVFDVMITDYYMPGMNGIELAKLAGKISNDTPIILYTGNFYMIDEQQINEAKIVDVVVKPCKIQDLDAVIKRVFNENLEATQENKEFRRRTKPIEILAGEENGGFNSIHKETAN